MHITYRTLNMSEYKALQALIRDDTKTFETELNKLTKDDMKTEISSIIDYIIIKNDIDSLYTFINFLEPKEIQLTLSTRNVKYMTNNNQWDMIKIMLDSYAFYRFSAEIFDSSNVDTLDKLIEYNIMSKLEIMSSIKSENVYKSAQIYQIARIRYPNLVNELRYKDIMLNTYNSNPTISNLKAVVDLVETEDDINTICRYGFDLERYNILVQKVSNEAIIRCLLNLRDMCFNSDLIDVIGIRVQLQAKIDQEEAKENNHFICCCNLIRYSGLNFRKKVLMESLNRMPFQDCELIVQNLSRDYFTPQEKSTHVIRYMYNYRYVDFLVKLGWKIYDTPENRIECEDHMDTYNQIPRY